MEYITALSQMDMFWSIAPEDLVQIVVLLRCRVPMWVENDVLQARLAGKVMEVTRLHRLEETVGEE